MTQAALALVERLSCSVEEQAHEGVGEPVLVALDGPAGVADEPEVGVGGEHAQGVGDGGLVVADAVRLVGQGGGELVDAVMALPLKALPELAGFGVDRGGDLEGA